MIVINNSKSVSFYTLGCKLNFSETSTIAESFRDAGYQEVPFEKNSNVCVINTCSVTENADKKFYIILKIISLSIAHVNILTLLNHHMQLLCFCKYPIAFL